MPTPHSRHSPIRARVTPCYTYSFRRRHSPSLCLPRLTSAESLPDSGKPSVLKDLILQALPIVSKKRARRFGNPADRSLFRRSAAGVPTMDGTATGVTGSGIPTLHACIRPTRSGSVRLSQGRTFVPTGARPRNWSDCLFGVAVDRFRLNVGLVYGGSLDGPCRTGEGVRPASEFCLRAV